MLCQHRASGIAWRTRRQKGQLTCKRLCGLQLEVRSLRLAVPFATSAPGAACMPRRSRQTWIDSISSAGCCFFASAVTPLTLNTQMSNTRPVTPFFPHIACTMPCSDPLFRLRDHPKTWIHPRNQRWAQFSFSTSRCYLASSVFPDLHFRRLVW